MFGSAQSLFGDLQSLKGRVRNPIWMGNLRRKAPVSKWGWERGTPVDRYYIKQFMEAHREDIHGNVLEVYDRTYIDTFGSNIHSVDVLDINADNPRATIIADLAAAHNIPDNTFDCFILTQTLQYIFDSRAALHHAVRILRPGGVLLTTVPALSRVDNTSAYWRFTQHSCNRLFGDAFGSRNVVVHARGNCVAAIATAAGLAAEEFHRSELDIDDPGYPILVCIRAEKDDPERPPSHYRVADSLSSS
jgi:SAM-dependent methyltransferase